MRAPRWAVGMRKIGPGVYVRESDKSLHISAEELCAHLGVPPTAANLDIAEKAAREVTRKACPDSTLEVRVVD